MSQDLNKKLIDRIYGRESMARIGKHAVIYNKLINKENLDTHKEYLKDVEVIFSTWGMPVLSEQDIEQYFPELKVVFYAVGSVQRFARPFLEKWHKSIDME